MKQGWSWLMAAWGVALIATLVALFIGEVMGMTVGRVRLRRVSAFRVARQTLSDELQSARDASAIK